jgi:2',3'-cyclic-nucleotide 2'-phosphodiesterase (5'-nucleotidase family)
MFKFQSIEMGADYLHGYDEGVKPGVKCVVTMQTGERSYEKTEFKLPPEAVKRVVQAAMREVEALIAINHDDIDVDGAAGVKLAPRNGVEKSHVDSYGDAL